MNPELKELAERAGISLSTDPAKALSGVALAYPHELAEFAALIAERCAEVADTRVGPARDIRELATRWRSVIPKND